MRYLDRFDDGMLVRWAFVGVLLGSAAVLGMDLRELVERNGGLWPEQSALQRTVTVLPPVVEAGGAPCPPRSVGGSPGRPRTGTAPAEAGTR